VFSVEMRIAFTGKILSLLHSGVRINQAPECEIERLGIVITQKHWGYTVSSSYMDIIVGGIDLNTAKRVAAAYSIVYSEMFKSSVDVNQLSLEV